MSSQEGAGNSQKVENGQASSIAKSNKRKSPSTIGGDEAGALVSNQGRALSRREVSSEEDDAYSRDAQLKQIKIVKGWLSAGMPLEKLDHFRPLLCHLGVDMADTSELRRHVGPIRKEEHLKLAEELGGGHYSIAFDGSPIFDQEAYGVLVRVVTEDLSVVERLVHFRLLDGPMNTIAAEVFDALFPITGLENRENCMAFHYDADAEHLKDVQGVLLDDLYGNAVGIQCMGHLFNHADGCIDTDMADTFTEGLERLLSYETNAHYEWKAQLGERFKFINTAARWGGGAHERNEDVMGSFSAVESFLREFKDDEGLPNHAAQRLVKLLDGEDTRSSVMLELAVLCDVGGALATAKCSLREETPLIEKAWDIVQRVLAVLGADSDQLQEPLLPRLEAVLSELTAHLQGDEKVAQVDVIRQRALACIKDLRAYAFEQVGGHDNAVARKQLLLFKAARAISPAFIAQYSSVAAIDVSGFAILPYVTPEVLEQLTTELPRYYALAKNLPDHGIATRDFWLLHKGDLPAWFDLVRVLWLIQPSSAMMDGVFSVMDNAFGCHDATQDGAVPNDLFELTVMLSYNRGRARGGEESDADVGGLGLPEGVLDAMDEDDDDE